MAEPRTRTQLLDLHADLTERLARLYRVHGETLAVEKEAKVIGFASWEDSDKRREMHGATLAIEQTKESFKEYGEIQALECERDHVRLLLAHYGLAG